jgi:hypothetical protein
MYVNMPSLKPKITMPAAKYGQGFPFSKHGNRDTSMELID